MKNTALIPIAILLFAGATASARQASTANPASPCNEQVGAPVKKAAIDHDPLVDPVEELRMRAQKKLDEKNFMELQDAAKQLAVVSAKMSKEIDSGGQFTFSLRVLDELDQIEKLTKKVRSRAK